MDRLFIFVQILTDNLLPITIVCFLIQVYLSTRKKWLWGLVFPMLFITVNLYWITNPLPSWRTQHPNMTAMNVFLWFPPTVILLIIFAVCRTRKRTKDKNKAI